MYCVTVLHLKSFINDLFLKLKSDKMHQKKLQIINSIL